MFDQLAAKLEKNTEVLDDSFEKCNLKLIQYRYVPFDRINNDDYDCVLILELSSIKSDEIYWNADIKVNLYDEYGKIFVNAERTLYCSNFYGYDTISVQLLDRGNTLKKAKSAKIFLAHL